MRLKNKYKDGRRLFACDVETLYFCTRCGVSYTTMPPHRLKEYRDLCAECRKDLFIERKIEKGTYIMPKDPEPVKPKTKPRHYTIKIEDDLNDLAAAMRKTARSAYRGQPPAG